MNQVATATAAVVIHGPQGCGKTTHAVALAKHYDKTRIVDDWTPGSRLSAETLALTNIPHQGAVPFDAAMRAAGLVMATAEPAAVAAATPAQAFVRVPGRTLAMAGGDIAVPDFLVGQYLTHIGAGGVAVIAADVVPTVRISYFDAVKAGSAAGLSLLTLSQSAVLALDVAEQAVNWSGGAVGDGTLLQGLHLGTVRGAVDGNYVSPNPLERRGFALSTGEIVYDVAGHLYTWLRDDVHGDERGLVATESLPGDSPVVCGAPAASGEQGVGWYPPVGRDWSGRALVRGGCWCSDSRAGVFYLDLVWPDGGDVSVGFRCTK